MKFLSTQPSKSQNVQLNCQVSSLSYRTTGRFFQIVPSLSSDQRSTNPKFSKHCHDFDAIYAIVTLSRTSTLSSLCGSEPEISLKRHGSIRQHHAFPKTCQTLCSVDMCTMYLILHCFTMFHYAFIPELNDSLYLMRHGRFVYFCFILGVVL